jgi:hypothetical protein
MNRFAEDFAGCERVVMNMIASDLERMVQSRSTMASTSSAAAGRMTLSVIA